MGFVAPGEQCAGSRQFADTGAVLHRLKNAAELAIRITHGDISNVDERVLLIDPEVSDILFSGLELREDFFHILHARLRVAVTDLAADNVLASGEDSMLRIGVERDEIIFVDEGDIKRQVLQYEVHLIKREFSVPHFELLIRAGSGGETVLSEKLLKIADETRGFSRGGLG